MKKSFSNVRRNDAPDDVSRVSNVHAQEAGLSGHTNKELIMRARAQLNNADSAMLPVYAQMALATPHEFLPVEALLFNSSKQVLEEKYFPQLELIDLDGQVCAIPAQFKKIKSAGTPKPENMRPRSKASVCRGKVRIYRSTTKVNGKEYYAQKYHFRIQINKQIYRIPLGYETEKAFKTAAKIHSAKQELKNDPMQILSKFHPDYQNKGAVPPVTVNDQPTVEKGIATVKEITDCFINNKGSLNVTKATAGGYRRCLLNIIINADPKLRTLKDEKKQQDGALQKPCTELTSSLVRAYKEEIVKQIGKDKQEMEQAKRGANSTLRQAKVLFSKDAMALYEDEGLRVPDMNKFRSSRPFKVKKQKYALPPIENIREVFAAIKALKIEDPESYLIALLALLCGLRSREIEKAQFEQLTDNAGDQVFKVGVTQNFVPKGASLRDVPISSMFKGEISSSSISKSNYIVGTRQLDRKKAAARLNNILRPILGDDIKKPTHELRRMYGTYVAKKFGLREAQARLGHEDYQTTEKYYAELSPSKEFIDLFEEFVTRFKLLK